VSGEYPSSEHGWSSDFPVFSETPAPYIRQALVDFLRRVSPEQINAWDNSIPPLQAEFDEILHVEPTAAGYSAILEYQLPMEHRRPDVVLLLGGGVLVLELKGKRRAELADVDQASAYARDLRAYHRECEHLPVHPALVLMEASGRLGLNAGVNVIGPDALDSLVGDKTDRDAPTVDRNAFLDPSAYRPLPTIVEAARELMATGELRRIKRADAATRPTLEYVSNVAHEAAATKSRHLVLVGGSPGTGKTLVGLQLAHARFLDDLAVARAGGDKPSAPAVYLSGNGPLVNVLQYELRAGGGGGATFVRPIKAYVQRYSSRPGLVPPEHVLIFDEAQRAFDAAQVAATHSGAGDGKSEPEHFVEFAERIPGWCVVVGLIGTGQEIHVGEEGGVRQWLAAVSGAGSPESWTVHVPPGLASEFADFGRVRSVPVLHLLAELRFHLAEDVHGFVRGLLGEDDDLDLPELAAALESKGYHLRLTRDLGVARRYLFDRYADHPDARFGMVASSRDADLRPFGIPNDFQSTKQINHGAWFGEGDADPRGRSCRTLRTCVTEFGCQGLELDATLLAWGSDFVRVNGAWSNRNAKRYQNPGSIHDALRLRRNAYRVLLTRARDATVVYVPMLAALDETYAFLVGAGFRTLESDDPE
jgi:hypothetical protein